MQIFMRAAFGMSEIPELRVQQSFLEDFFPWSRRVTWYLYFSLLVTLIILGSLKDCLDYPWFAMLANGKHMPVFIKMFNAGGCHPVKKKLPRWMQ